MATGTSPKRTRLPNEPASSRAVSKQPGLVSETARGGAHTASGRSGLSASATPVPVPERPAASERSELNSSSWLRAVPVHDDVTAANEKAGKTRLESPSPIAAEMRSPTAAALRASSGAIEPRKAALNTKYIASGMAEPARIEVRTLDASPSRSETMVGTMFWKTSAQMSTGTACGRAERSWCARRPASTPGASAAIMKVNEATRITIMALFTPSKSPLPAAPAPSVRPSAAVYPTPMVAGSAASSPAAAPPAWSTSPTFEM
mmetsp:Transcript_110175/g.320840  ORF Transcript_110175/g.320840 Transcript_110175/m.320840 type:complete len:262 (-) Transcript_110175:845-1630(-)